MSAYTKDFYANYQGASENSGELILGEIFKHFKPGSMVDVGCGIGTWLAAAQRLGVTEVTGIDGNYVDQKQLLIAPTKFKARDLSQTLDTANLGRYDMALSVEVAEHLPESVADGFVKALTNLSDVVFFSAAIPGQGGTYHINEQWPAWWAEKFAAQGYLALDIIKSALWDQPGIAYYYVQNGVLYVKESFLETHPELGNYVIPKEHWSLRSVHFRKWTEACDPNTATFRFTLKALPGSLSRALKLRVNRLFRRGF